MSEQCKAFKAFPPAPEVCDECGQVAADHAVKDVSMLPYAEAVWKFMLERGGPYNYYGAGPETEGYPERDKVIQHLKNCELDLEQMALPELESKDYFNGTFTDGTYRTEILIGTIVCKCGKYEASPYAWGGQDWCVADMTLSKIIWHVVKAGEIK